MNILQKIIAHKKKEIEKEKKKASLDSYRKSVKPSERDFYANLEGKADISLIAEVKKGSPSAGVIVEDFDPRRVTNLYRKYANCISVLTDKEFFYGSFENLKIVRENTDLPILCKDFIIDEYQIYKARHFGADAILLIAGVLEVDEMQKLFDVCIDLSMDVIFEAHNEDELDKILKVKGSKIIGINNRDLKSFDIDIQNTVKLAGYLGKTSFVLISESGISSALDVSSLKGVADAILVGTSIMKESSPEEKIYELSALPKIKICGITNIEDASDALYFGASYLGAILAPSPRKVNLDFLKELSKLKKESDEYAKIVGVFVNEDIPELKKTLAYIDIMQLHGDEDDEYIEKLRALTNKPIWKAISIKDKNDLARLPNSSDKLLLDTYSEKERGGTGITFNWNDLNALPLNVRRKIVIAGGINPENAKQASCHADVLDVGSGVEEKKGKKSKQKLRELFRSLRR